MINNGPEYVYEVVERVCLDMAQRFNAGYFNDPRAKLLLLAIAGQEADWRARKQEPVAYAAGLWQFEKGDDSALDLLLRSSKLGDEAAELCRLHQVPVAEDGVYTRENVWKTFIVNDELAAGFARLLLASDANPLPEIGEQDEGWNTYRRNWKPGKPRPKAWPRSYSTALETFNRFGRTATPPPPVAVSSPPGSGNVPVTWNAVAAGGAYGALCVLIPEFYHAWYVQKMPPELSPTTVGALALLILTVWRGLIALAHVVRVK